MTKQEPNPYAYGYARMPRIIRKGYKNLTNMQKLLYIYLRDLCGEDGTCYRSLRSLKDETGFSIGYLSVAIPVLHNEGLIHAEMRKTSSTHWEVWHISVIDIWEKNAAFLQAEKAKCSPDEQMNEQSVQDMNRSVHQMNTIAESVHEVNESVHAMILNKNHTNNQLTENKDKEESIVTSAIAGSDAPALIDFTEQKKKRDTEPRLPAVKGQVNDTNTSSDILHSGRHGVAYPGSRHLHTSDSSIEDSTQGLASHSQCLSEEDITDAPTEKMRITKPEQTIASSGTPDAAQRTIASPQASNGSARTNGAVQASIPKRPGSRKPLVLPVAAPELPQEALRIMDAWDSLFKAPLARTDKHIKAALALIPCHPSKDDLKNCKNWLFTTDNPQKPWFRKKGVSLQDIAENYGQWQSVQEVPQEQQNGNAKRDENIGVSGLPRFQRREVKYG